MLFRFSEVPILDNGKYDYDNTKYIGTIDHKDYTEYTKLLHFMKEQEDECGKGLLNVDVDKDKEMQYTIVDINLRIPLDKINLECMEIYISPSF